MATELTANTDLDDLAERLGVGEDEQLRSSGRRERFLQKYARIMTMEPDLNLSLNPEIAAAAMSDDLEEDRIFIPTKKQPQPVTDIPPKQWSLLAQEAVTTHEIGHILYSDTIHMQQLIEDRIDDSKDQQAFHLVWNATEDGVIEKQLRSDFNCDEELHLLNENIATANQIGRAVETPNGEERYIYTLLDAIVAAILDLGHHNVGRTKKILDEDDETHTITTYADEERFKDFLPNVRKLVKKTHSEPDAQRRNEICYKFWEQLEPLLDDADTSGREETHGGSEAISDGRPDDSSEALGRAKSDADALPDEEAIEAGMPNPEEDGEEEEAGGGAGDEEEGGYGDDDIAKTPSGENIEEVAEEMKEEYAEELKAEVEEELGDVLEEYSKIIDILGEQGGPGNQTDSLLIPDPSEYDADRFREAQRLANRLEPILKDTLRQERRTETRRNLRTGSLDQRRLMRTVRDDYRVFERSRNDEEKDYKCVLVVDRSGSMSGDIQDVEKATTAFSLVLENLGVETMVLDFYQGNLRLAKAFGQKATSSKGTLVTEDVGGGTPLTEAVGFARERLESSGGMGSPFCICITDGRAHSKGTFQEEVDACNFPVMGVYLRGTEATAADLRDELEPFHRGTVVSPSDDLGMKLRELAHEIFL